MSTLEEIYMELKEGKIKLYQLEKAVLEGVYNSDKSKFLEANRDAVNLRLRFLEENKSKNFENIRKSFVSIADA